MHRNSGNTNITKPDIHKQTNKLTNNQAIKQTKHQKNATTNAIRRQGTLKHVWCKSNHTPKIRSHKKSKQKKAKHEYAQEQWPHEDNKKNKQKQTNKRSKKTICTETMTARLKTIKTHT